MTGAAGDRPLVDAARAGDRAAFARLHDEWAPMVHGILLARVPGADAEDLAQETFLAAYRRLGQLRDGAAFGPWLAAIARRRAADFRRRARPARELPQDLPARDSRDGRDRHDDEVEEALAAIRSLPEAYRETLALRPVEGMTGPEIAARTGLTPGSVRVNLCRGMRLLRERLGLEDRP